MTTLRVPAGFSVESHAAVGSTNAVAFERAAAGAPSGLWTIAARQTSGRGRLGRTWASEPGNLFCSLLLREGLAPSRFGELPLVAALAVHDAVTEALPPTAAAALRIKWPNDVLYDGAKLSGILVEGALRPEGQVVVIGIGINCHHHPDTSLYPATDLASLGYPVEPADMFSLLAEHLARRLDQWHAGPFEPLRAAWLDRACGLGEPISVRLPSGTRTGVFDGLDADGRLELRVDGRLETIAAGDVFFNP
jgi:BirA family biotin operon repressor/biotin-[acetyl-CoA-carboxylase] ligase